MAADMDPNDHDTVHFFVIIPFVGFQTTCRTYRDSIKTTGNWDEVTCRMCVFHKSMRGS